MSNFVFVIVFRGKHRKVFLINFWTLYEPLHLESDAVSAFNSQFICATVNSFVFILDLDLDLIVFIQFSIFSLFIREIFKAWL